MKHIDEIYKEWCGEHHTTNSCHPVHDSAEACDFAEYYHEVMTEANEVQEPDATAILPHVRLALSGFWEWYAKLSIEELEWYNGKEVETYLATL